MKKVILILFLILFSVLSYGQTPVKLNGKTVLQLWSTNSSNDTNKMILYKDSVQFKSSNRLLLDYPSYYLIDFANTGGADTLFLFSNGVTGKIDTITKAALISMVSASMIVDSALWADTSGYSDNSGQLQGYDTTGIYQGAAGACILVQKDTITPNCESSFTVWIPSGLRNSYFTFIDSTIFLKNPSNKKIFEVGKTTTSLNFGEDNSVTGSWAGVMGYGDTATGQAAFAIGEDCNASNWSLATGSQTEVTGNYSFGYGDECTSSGNYSGSGGFQSTASGNYSVSIGYQNLASTLSSVAIGRNLTASGLYAVALGTLGTASGSYSSVMGHKSVSSGYASTAIGDSCYSSANFATSFGRKSIASGLYSFAQGVNTTAAGISAISMGNGNNANGNNSVALGLTITTTGAAYGMGGNLSLVDNGTFAGTVGLGYANTVTDSWAMGYSNTISAGSVGLGYSLSGTGNHTFVAGRSSTANYDGNIAIGYLCRAVNPGYYTTAIGYRDTTSGIGAVVMGMDNKTSIDYSVVMGYNSKGTKVGSSVIGNNLTTTKKYALHSNNFYVADTLWCSDSSYIIEETDTLRIYSPKVVKIGSNSLIIKRDGTVDLETSDFRIKGTLMFEFSDSTYQINSSATLPTVTHTAVKVISHYAGDTDLDSIRGHEHDGTDLELWGTSDTRTVTVTNSKNIHLDNGLPFILGNHDVIIFKRVDGEWYEKSRKNNN